MITIENTQYIIEEWFLKKYNINMHKAYIIRETELAILLNFETLKGQQEKWIPKSVIKKIDLTKQRRVI